MISLIERESYTLINASNYITAVVTILDYFRILFAYERIGEAKRWNKEDKSSWREGRKITHLHLLPTWPTGDSGRAVPLPLQAGKDIL